MRHPPLIGIVGACASGKSTLTRQLTSLGYNCRHIAQEHSYVPEMWQILTQPDILIYLDVSYEKTLERKRLNWTKEEFEIQVERLSHAKANSDLIIHTDLLSVEELTHLAVQQIERLLVQSMNTPLKN